MTNRGRIGAEIAAILLVAAAVQFLPGGHQGAAIVEATLLAVFAIAIAWIAERTYRERRMSIEGLGDRRRGALYAALAVAALDLVAHGRLVASTAGLLVFWLLIGLVAGVLIALLRSAQRY